MTKSRKNLSKTDKMNLKILHDCLSTSQRRLSFWKEGSPEWKAELNRIRRLKRKIEWVWMTKKERKLARENKATTSPPVH